MSGRNAITKPSNGTESPLISRFAKLSLIPAVDGGAASAYITADAGGGQRQEWKCSRATAKT
jgi:hypothetical protein